MFAEVIGDPIAQSKSPVIHRHWLGRLAIKGDYYRTRVAPSELREFLRSRREDPDWRGCNVTIPHKEAILPLLDHLDPKAAAIGAVNCVVPQGAALVGYNSDIDGVAMSLQSTHLSGRKAAIIGAGGAARAVLFHLAQQGVGEILLFVRNPERAGPLRALAPQVKVEILPVGQAGKALCGVSAIINASPLGMAGDDPMPQPLLDAIGRHVADATVFDLVTTPPETDFLSAGRTAGCHCVDGLVMLAAQAARAFELFFGAPAPSFDEALRAELIKE